MESGGCYLNIIDIKVFIREAIFYKDSNCLEEEYVGRGYSNYRSIGRKYV